MKNLYMSITWIAFGNAYTVRNYLHVKFMFSKKATKINEIFTVDLTLCSKCQIDGEDFVNFCGLFLENTNFTPNFWREYGRFGVSYHSLSSATTWEKNLPSLFQEFVSKCTAKFSHLYDFVWQALRNSHFCPLLHTQLMLWSSNWNPMGQT